MTIIKKLLNYKTKEPEYALLAFQYADEYAHGLFMKGTIYGVFIGIILTLIALIFLV